MPFATIRPLLSLFLIAASWFSVGSAVGAPLITAIRFEGNDTTEPRILRQEMTIKVGDPADPGAIERSRQAIMDLGLFKSVQARLEEADEGQALVITVDEKYYILPLPRADADPDGDYEYGAELKFDNIAGLNQRLELMYLVHQSVDGADPQREEATLDYAYPRLAGSAYDIALRMRLRRETLEQGEEPDLALYERDAYDAAVNLARWLEREGPSQGWRGGVGLNLEQWRWKHIRGVDPHEDSQAVGFTLSADYVRVHDFGLYRDGIAYGWNGEVAAPGLGSDYSYNRTRFYARAYNPLGGYRNLNWRLQLGLASGQRFGGPAFDVGGRSLHGYESDYAEGNAFMLANVEYLHPVSGYKQFRLVGIFDAGNAYADVQSIDPTDIEVGVGIGARWRVQSFVDVNLAFDWGYGLGSQEQYTFFTTSGTF